MKHAIKDEFEVDCRWCPEAPHTVYVEAVVELNEAGEPVSVDLQKVRNPWTGRETGFCGDRQEREFRERMAQEAVDARSQRSAA